MNEKEFNYSNIRPLLAVALLVLLCVIWWNHGTTEGDVVKHIEQSGTSITIAGESVKRTERRLHNIEGTVDSIEGRVVEFEEAVDRIKDRIIDCESAVERCKERSEYNRECIEQCKQGISICKEIVNQLREKE